MKQFLKFGIVGGIGFIVDFSILWLLARYYLVDIYLARIISFCIAVFTTWLLNRNLTFVVSNTLTKQKEYSYYFIIQTIGAILNYTIFILLIQNISICKEFLILPLAIASVIVMFFNFLALKKFLY